MNGWYVLFLDGIPSGAFGSWKTGATHTWSAKSMQAMNPAERADLQRKVELSKRQREVEVAKNQALAARRADQIWRQADHIQVHPYLVRKGIQAFGLRAHRGNLIIPVRDVQGRIHSLQFIANNGEKHFLSSGAIKNNFHLLGDLTDRLLICEGYATGASLHEATGWPVAIAFNSTNLLSTSQALREAHPSLTLIVAADDDQWTDGNPGLTKAQEAAQVAKALMVVPVFSDLTARPSDFNDLHALEGLDQVRAQVLAAFREPQGDAISAPSDQRPVIRWVGGEIRKILDQAEAALLGDTKGESIYQRGGILVRVIRKDATSRARLRRSPGALSILPVEAITMRVRFTEAARWERFDGRSHEWCPINCPVEVASAYMAEGGNWHLPTLLGVIEAPTLRPDGSILDQYGYDADTGLYFHPGGLTFAVPPTPSLEDARTALSVLLDLLKDFPFEAEYDRSVAISAILTAMVRRSLKSAPMFVFTAPKMGSGKSLLADVVALIATGRPASVMSQAETPQEEAKRVVSVLMEGDPVVVIDNVERPLGSDVLCSVLTQEVYKDRLLGQNRTVEVPTCNLWLATGNNLLIKGDLSTRVLPCSLDPAMERPEERSFAVNLYHHIPAHRAQLVNAALTILRAYHLAGRPRPSFKPWGRFEEWSGWIRAALVWLGMPDPCLAREKVEDADPVRSQLRNLLGAWTQLFGSEAVSLSQAITEASASTDEWSAIELREYRQALSDAMLDISGERGLVNTRRMGKWMQHHVKRVEKGLRLEQAGKDRAGVMRWRVVPMASE